MHIDHQEEDFINDILLEAGFNPEKDNFDELRKDIEELLMDRIMERVFDELSQEQKGKVISLFEKGEEDKALMEIETMIPDYDNFLADIFQEFRDDYLREVK